MDIYTIYIPNNAADMRAMCVYYICILLSTYTCQEWQQIGKAKESPLPSERESPCACVCVCECVALLSVCVR